MKKKSLEHILVKQMTVEDVLKYKENLSNFIYDSVKMSKFEESYTKEQAVVKVSELYGYIETNRAIALGAFLDSDMVGFLWAYSYPFREDSNRFYISILHVLDNYRGFHIGKKLLDCIELIAKDRSVKKLYLHAEASNTRACKFYEENYFSKERIQYVKELDYSDKIGGVLTADSEIINKYYEQFVELYYENVKNHEYETEFNINDAKHKINELQNYLMKGKAYYFYTLEDDTVTAFMWAHPIYYKGNSRIYIHAFGTKPQFAGKGYASLLYEFLLKFCFEENVVYTHVDATNRVSCHIQEKFGFVPELIQYQKSLS